MTEDQLEQEALGWLASVGYTPLNARDLDHLDPRLERSSTREVVLVAELRAAIDRLNPNVPAAAGEDALKQVLDVVGPALLTANKAFHKLLVNGVPVQYQKDGDTRGDFVRLMDWHKPEANTWLAVQQFTIKGPRHTRRPDIVLFINGLPLVLVELKNPADAHADIWKASSATTTMLRRSLKVGNVSSSSPGMNF